MLLHQIGKDLRLLKWQVAAWVGAVSAANVVVLWVAASWSPSRETVDRVNFVLMLLDLAATGALVVIAASLVQHDSPVSPTAFWTTRPLPAYKVAAGKILFALPILVLVPLAWNGFTLAALGVSPAWMPRLTAAVVAIWVFMPMAVAAVTSNLAQFFLIGLFEFVIFTAIIGIAAAFGVRAATSASGVMGVISVAVVVSAAIMIFAYLTRRQRATAALLGIAPLALFAVAAVAWPSKPSVDYRADFDREYQGNLSVEVDKKEITTATPGTGRAGGAGAAGTGVVIDIPVHVRGLPPGTAATVWPAESDSWLQQPSNRLVPTSSRQWSGRADAATRRFVEACLGDHVTLLNPAQLPPTSPEVRYAFRVPASLFSQVAGEDVTLHVAAGMRLEQWRVADARRLRPGLGVRVEGGALEVGDVRVAGRRLIANVRETHPSPRGGVPPWLRCLLRNRSAAEAIAPQYHSSGADLNPWQSALKRLLPVSEDVAVNWYELVFDLGPSEYARASGDAAWWADAQLVVMTRQTLGTKQVELDVPGVRFRDLPTTPPPPAQGFSSGK